MAKKGRFELSMPRKLELYDKYETREIGAGREPMTLKHWATEGGCEDLLKARAATPRTAPKPVKKVVPKPSILQHKKDLEDILEKTK